MFFFVINKRELIFLENKFKKNEDHQNEKYQIDIYQISDLNISGGPNAKPKHSKHRPVIFSFIFQLVEHASHMRMTVIET